MIGRAAVSRILGALEAPAHRPRVTVACTVALIIAAIICINRFHASGSLEAMLDQGDPAAAALARVADRFQTPDTLLLVATARAAGERPADPRAALLEFADRFTRAAESDSALGPQIARVQFRVDGDSDERRFIEDEIVPNALLYVSDDEFQLLRERLTLESMREQIHRNEEMLAAPGPAADVISRQLLRDPLRLRELLGASLARRAGVKETMSEDGAFFSRDGHGILVRIAGVRPVRDIDFAKALLANARRIAESVNVDGLQLEYTGAYAIAAAGERAIRADMVRSVLGSVLLMQILFLLVYRNLFSFVMAIIPTGVGIVLAFAIMSFVTTQLTPVTAVIGAVLAGLGIDYCIHILSEYERGRAAGRSAPESAASATRVLAAPIALAAGSSILGFIAIAQSSVRALQEFAWLGALGLAASMIAALMLLPALLVFTTRKGTPTKNFRDRSFSRLRLEYLIHRVHAHRSLFIGFTTAVVMAAVFIVLLARDSVVPIESDLSVMHPRPNPALELQLDMGERFGGAADSMIVYHSAETPDELVRDAHRLARSLESAGTAGETIAGTYGLATYLPDPDALAARRAAIASIDADRVIADFRRSLDDSLFNPAAYEPFMTFLRRFLRPGDGPDLETLRNYPELAATMLPRRTASDRSAPAEALTMVHFNRPLADQSSRASAIASVRDALNSIPRATLTGMTVIGHDTQAAVRRDLARQLAVASIAVIVLIFLVFRSALDTFVTLLPTAFAMIVTLACMRLFGDGFNMINLIGLPLLAGIGVDNGIFVTSMARRARNETDPVAAMKANLSAGLQAIVMTSATTGLAFGSLVFTSVPAIQSLGRLTAVGIIATLLGTIFLQVPIHLARSTVKPS